MKHAAQAFEKLHHFIPRLGRSTIVLALLLSACTGAPERPLMIKGSKGGVNNPGNGDGVIKTPEDQPLQQLTCTPGNVNPGPAPILRLSKHQYTNAVQSLVGTLNGIEALLPEEKTGTGLGAARAAVSLAEVEAYDAAAASVAKQIADSGDKLNSVAPCTNMNDKRGCAQEFIKSFGPKVFRISALEDASVQSLMAVYDASAADDYKRGVTAVLKAMFQSPRFIYRPEIAGGESVAPGITRLQGSEIASRLAFALWDSAPDARLLEAAAAGELNTKEGVLKQLDIMLKDSRAQSLNRRFIEGWLKFDKIKGVSRDPAHYPEWNDSLRNAMVQQSQLFLDDVFSKQGGTLDALLTSKKVFYNKELAGFYGAQPEDGFKSVEKPEMDTSGILSLPILMTILGKPGEPSPIFRGIFVREALLCQHLLSAPAEIPAPPEISPNSSSRERLLQHTKDPSCGSCHIMIDPVGLGFETFDAIGRFRSMDGGRPVNATGELHSAGDIEGKFDGVAALGAKLASSETVEECVVRQWFRFVQSRFEVQADSCSIKGMVDDFKASGGKIDSLVKSVVGSDAFLYKRSSTEAKP